MGCHDSKEKPSAQIVDSRTLNCFDSRSRYSHRPLETDFIVEPTTVLGKGYSGVVTKAQHRLTNQECAVKALPKKGLSQERLRSLRFEVNNYLRIDHPHIARLLHVYEDNQTVSLVMEICEGRELFDRVSRKRFSEPEAMRATYQMLLAIAYLHRHNIVHCDIKLENFLYDSDTDDANLKLIDFGFSKKWDGGKQAMRVAQGTLSYTAPEVFAGRYTDKCDMWSLGVVVFILLGGSPPFPMADAAKCRKAIMKGVYTFDKKRWKGISEAAVDFVRGLLVADPEQRRTATECLDHPWLARAVTQARSASGDLSCNCSSVGGESAAPSGDSEGSPRQHLLNDFRSYRRGSRLTRAALTMMAQHLSSRELEQIQQTFLWLDTDRTGTITRDNFRVALSGHFSDLGEEELGDLFDCADVTRDGEIHYSEFIAALMQSRIEIKQGLVREVFDLFDVSGTGTITQSDLKHVLGCNLMGEELLGCAGGRKKIVEMEGSLRMEGITFEQFADHLQNASMESEGCQANEKLNGDNRSEPKRRRWLTW